MSHNIADAIRSYLSLCGEPTDTPEADELVEAANEYAATEQAILEWREAEAQESYWEGLREEYVDELRNAGLL